jgi:uncharacterized protein (TIGR02246 family)
MTNMPDDAAVEEANAAFYQAFEMLDSDLMAEIWADDDSIRCVHPGWALLAGRAPVLESWARIFDNAAMMKFDIANTEITVEGSLAWVNCTERLTSVQGGRVSEGSVQTTNLFRKQDGRWLLIHHHGSPVMG